jgi:hypothetical protein
MIIGFHADGSQCQSYSCGLKHFPPGQVTEELIKHTKSKTSRMRAVAEQKLAEVEQELAERTKPALRPYSAEWFDSLTPEQQEEFRAAALEAMAAMGTAVRHVATIVQQMAGLSPRALAAAFKPVAEFAERHEAFLRETAGSEPAGLNLPLKLEDKTDD